jgi:acylphosphatase
MEKARVHVIIEGQVQGVLFRRHTHEVATQLGLMGWVKNRRDGSVEAVFEGDRKGVNDMIEWCHHGPPAARVTAVHPSWEECRGEFEDFSITY